MDHYSNVTEALWHLESPQTWQFVENLVQADNKEIIKSLIAGPLWGESTHCWHIERGIHTLLALCEGNPPVPGGFPSQRASNFYNFHTMTSSCTTFACAISPFHLVAMLNPGLMRFFERNLFDIAGVFKMTLSRYCSKFYCHKEHAWKPSKQVDTIINYLARESQDYVHHK